MSVRFRRKWVFFGWCIVMAGLFGLVVRLNSFEWTQHQSVEQPPQELVPADRTDDWPLLLVNRESPLPEGYIPELTEVQNGYRMDSRVAPYAAQMIEAARADGVELYVCSAYRSVEKQESLYADKVSEYIGYGNTREEAQAIAGSIVAIPGTSEHHTGLAADIVTPSYMVLDSGFGNTKAFSWLSKHAAEYGFVLRFPEDKQEITGIIYEPWHYRYVGRENAAMLGQKGWCLEEYHQSVR